VARMNRPSDRAPRSCASGTSPALTCFSDEDIATTNAEARLAPITSHPDVTEPPRRPSNAVVSSAQLRLHARSPPAPGRERVVGGDQLP